MIKNESEWLLSSLLDHREVSSVTRVNEFLVAIDRKTMPRCIVAAISGKRVTETDLEPLLSSGVRPEIIVSVPKQLVWEGAAIKRLESAGVAFGRMYDLYRAINYDADVSEYINPELFYVSRLFAQHPNVFESEALTDRLYVLRLFRGPEILVALSDDYEVTADVVRTASDRHGHFHVLLKNNPYGRISRQGSEAASKLGIKVLDQEDFFQVLHSEI
ncbi:hypothetical protein PSC71_09400 [Devosia sp. J2-20]|uniref:hypothetical protein n=1 Tax=Devosia sp. J2-20 TaxID=3026161 RepID=UPI00249CD882|nr:hypothetical protein [Devosia sp. J2-20]WDR00929.1 hypothetical protein PSC71_09400 [Devosia sp. J2-20]